MFNKSNSRALKTRQFVLSALMVATFTISSGPAYAGQQYVDKTGYAASGYDVVAFYSLKRTAGNKNPKAIPGKSAISTQWNGAKWAFSSEENRAMFLKSPTSYAPAYDGHCAYGVAKNAKVPANPHLWQIVDDRLYLNITKGVAKTWAKDVPGYITEANTRWAKLETGSPSTDPVPAFSVAKAPVK